MNASDSSTINTSKNLQYEHGSTLIIVFLLPPACIITGNVDIVVFDGRLVIWRSPSQRTFTL
eukprot:3722661-Amphidinium_carterae.1